MVYRVEKSFEVIIINELSIAVIQFPGSNREYELARAFESVGMLSEVFRWKRNSEELKRFHGYALPGGFSYQDRNRAGSIAVYDRTIEVIADESERYGKPVIGICNGNQILVEAGLVPNTWKKLDIGMAPNAGRKDGEVVRTGFISDWVYVVHTGKLGRSVATKLFDEGELLPIPIAHGEGRYEMSDATLQELDTNGQILWKYATADGVIDPNYPANPNGSKANIAGICNKRGNVIAFMPHPEAANWLYQMRESVWSEKLEAQGIAERMNSPGAWRRFFESVKLHLYEVLK